MKGLKKRKKTKEKMLSHEMREKEEERERVKRGDAVATIFAAFLLDLRTSSQTKKYSL